MVQAMAHASRLSRGAQLLAEWRDEALQCEVCRLLDIDPASYNRFERGVRKPNAEISFRIERLTDGRVPARSWYEPPKRRAA